MQKFWKRLRKALPTPIKHFYCGEYGDRTKRPHYHAAVFGYAVPADAKTWDTENVTSETLSDIWGMGIVTISELTPYRMAYVAGYVLKKAGYKKQIYCTEDGVELQPPFRKMSQGLGRQWLDKYADDLHQGHIDTGERKIGVPRYYLDKIKKNRPGLYKLIKEANEKNRLRHTENDPARNKAAEKIREQAVKRARRDRV